MNQEQESQAAIILAAKATKAAHRHSPPETAPVHAAAVLWSAFVIVLKSQGIHKWRGMPLE